MKTRTIAMLLTVALVAHVRGQEDQTDSPNLTKAEEGRVAISQCYAGCMETAAREAARYGAAVERLIELRFRIGGFRTLSIANRNRLETSQENAVCLTLQNAIRLIDACRAGCVDLEAVYGVSSSHARNRFRHELNNDKLDKLQRAARGLWIDYQNSPDSDDPNSEEFDAACRAFFSPSTASDGSGALSRVTVRPAEPPVPPKGG